MIPRLQIDFPIRSQWHYWTGKPYAPTEGEYLLNHARSGIVLALRIALPHGGRVGVVAYNCHTVANAVEQSNCMPVFLDVTEELRLQTDGLKQKDLDAIVVSNLFGIQNDISIIRQECPNAIIIVDNAHGYCLPPEGDFTVYSIGQGKLPSVGDGGILMVNNPAYKEAIDVEYAQLPTYGAIAQVKLFISMLLKAMLYSPVLYGWLTMRLKSGRTNAADKNPIAIRRMPLGVSRMYAAVLPAIAMEIEKRRANARNIAVQLCHQDNIIRSWYGANAFMLLLECKDVEQQKSWFAERGIETETHFKNAIRWAEEFGYHQGECPMAEKLTERLLMVPTYKEINQKNRR